MNNENQKNQEYGFSFELDDFQKEALDYISDGKSVVVCAPTGAGKTCIAEFAIQRAIKNNERIFYTTPLKALSNQKFSDFSLKYGENRVGLLTGDTSINRDAQIVVMTTEVFRNMLYGTTFGDVKTSLNNVKYVVLDEVHYMNDEQRGTVWEESIIYCPTDIQIIALSATVANSQQLTDWINTVHSKTELVYTDFRPVPLRHFYYDSNNPNTIMPLLTPDGKLNRKIRPEKRGKDFRKKMQNRSTSKDVINILREKNMLPAIYFTFSRKKCDEQMEKAAQLDLITFDERKQIEKIIEEYLKENEHLRHNKHLEYLFSGVASHHAGLLPGWKVLVEKLFQKGLIKVVFATETLAAGINMPARSTVISAVSKRTDSGHRMLTGSEFMQMSGRAGRRGMDEIGYVTIIGTPFQSPDEVADLVLQGSNPLESRFTPSYSMVLNLLQRFSLDETKELILKSFGYYSSNDRLKPLFVRKTSLEKNIVEADSFKCPYKNVEKSAFYEYQKAKNQYVEYRKIAKTLKKQAKQKGQKNAPEVVEFNQKTSDFYKQMISVPCGNCPLYKKHVKNIELCEKLQKKLKEIEKQIETEKDIYWKTFLKHKTVLEKTGYLQEDFPTEKGKTTAGIRAENELFLSEIFLSGVLDELNEAQLASVICAITTEDLRADLYMQTPIEKDARKTLNKIKDIRRKISIVEKEEEIHKENMYINSYYSPLIEYWVNGGEWDTLIEQIEAGEGDVVRIFKRTIDVLRQITILPNLNPNLQETAKSAIKAILRSPIDID